MVLNERKVNFSPWEIKLVQYLSLDESFHKMATFTPQVSKLAKIVLGYLKSAIYQIIPLNYSHVTN